jgi:hypothetical protein
MATNSAVLVTPGDEKRINSGLKRKICISKWTEKTRKMLRDSGNPYISKRKDPVPGKLPPTKISLNNVVTAILRYRA